MVAVGARVEEGLPEGRAVRPGARFMKMDLEGACVGPVGATKGAPVNGIGLGGTGLGFR